MSPYCRAFLGSCIIDLCFSDEVRIALRFACVAGGVPSTWANYSDLMLVDISSNNLTGSLPPAWSSLTNLRYLNMSSNSLSGGLPDSWRQSSGNNDTVDQGMVNLQYL